MNDLIKSIDLRTQFLVSDLLMHEHLPFDYSLIYQNILKRISAYGSDVAERDRILAETLVHLPQSFKVEHTNPHQSRKILSETKQSNSKRHPVVEDKLKEPIQSNELEDLIAYGQNLLQNVSQLDDLLAAVSQMHRRIFAQEISQSKLLFFRGQHNPDILWINDCAMPSDEQANQLLSDPSGRMLLRFFRLLGYHENSQDSDQRKLIGFSYVVFWALSQPTALLNDIHFKICVPFTLKLIEILKPKYVFVSGFQSVSFLTDQKETHPLKFSQIELLNQAQAYTVPSLSMLCRSGVVKKNFWFDLLQLLDHNPKK